MTRKILGLITLFISLLSSAQDPALMGPAQSTILSEVNKPVFKKNSGQYDKKILYRMTSGQSSVAFYKNKIQFGLRKQGKQPMKSREDMGSTAFVIWELGFENMNIASFLSATQKLPSIYNSFNRADGISTDIEEYGKLTYKNIYDKIDLVFYLDQTQTLKYDFIVHPGGDYSKIKLVYDGVKKLKTDKKGNLTMVTPWGNKLKEGKPICWQETKNGKVAIDFNYNVKGKTLTYLTTSELQPNATLIIDPMVLDWSSYFYGKNIGSSTWGWTYVLDMDVDKNNNVYVVGMTSEAYPMKVGAYDTTIGSTSYEGFVAKMKLNADSILSFTYIGGSNWEYILSVAVNSQLQPVISGITYSTDYPVTSGAYDNSSGSSTGYRGFITKFASDFKSLVFSTYFGKAGGWNNVIQAMALTPNGDVVFTGQTADQNFPVTTGCYQSKYGGGTYDAFLTRLSADGSKLIYSTYLGGDGADQAYDLSINAAEDVYLVGSTSNSRFPITVGAQIFKNSNSDAMDGFVSKIQKDGKKLLWSHVMGGNDLDAFEGLFVNSNDELYIAGYSKSSNFYVTSKAVQPSNAGGYDHIVVKMNKAGTNVYYSTYLGGSGDDYYYSGGIWASNIRITANVKDEAIIGGITKSTNYPITKDALQKVNKAGTTSWWATNLAITKLDYFGDRILYGTYFGGSYWEWPTVLKVKKIGCMSSILYGGITGSTDYPTTKGVYHEKGKTTNGNYSGFMSRFRDTLYTEPIDFIPDFTECDEVYEILDAKNRGADFLWSDGSKLQNLIVDKVGTYWVRATYGCDTVTDTIRIKLEYSPKVNLTADTLLCNNTVGLILDAENDTILRKYKWSTNDTTRTINVKNPGTYMVTVSTPHCGTISDTSTVRFLKTPKLSNIRDTLFCDSMKWTVKTDSLGIGTKYKWSTGSKDTGLFININQVGNYQLKVKNQCGIDSVSFNTYLLYKPKTDLGKDTIACNTFKLSYKVGRPNNDEYYSWYDVKTRSGYATTDTFTMASPGTLGISIQNSCGTFIDSVKIFQRYSPILNLGKDSVFCNAIKKTIAIGKIGNDETYVWNSAKTTNTETILKQGIYWAKIKNMCGEIMDSILFTQKNSLKIDLGNDTVFCNNVSKTLDITQPDPDAVYQWNDLSSNKTYTSTKPGKVWASITNFCGKVSDTAVYSILVTPTVNLGKDYTFCDIITPIPLTVGNAINNETYIWSDATTGKSATFNTMGKHWVQIANKCGIATDTMEIFVVTSPTVNIGPDTALCGIFNLPLDAGNPGLTYYWEPTGETTQTIEAHKQTIYKVTVTDANGCFGKDEMHVKDDCKSKWFIPTSFSPNGDLINDEFVPTLINCEHYSLHIYNTWGEKLFETTDPFAKWDGTYNGKVVQDGNYLYTINFMSSETKKWYLINGGLLILK